MLDKRNASNICNNFDLIYTPIDSLVLLITLLVWAIPDRPPKAVIIVIKAIFVPVCRLDKQI